MKKYKTKYNEAVDSKTVLKKFNQLAHLNSHDVQKFFEILKEEDLKSIQKYIENIAKLFEEYMLK